jgi:hypothetical protein
MEIFIIINKIHYDKRRRRFQSLVFKNSTGGGISVFKNCADISGKSICQYIKEYYPPPVSSEPPIFWLFDENILPTGYRLIQETRQSGDICHYNIHGLSNKVAR